YRVILALELPLTSLSSHAVEECRERGKYMFVDIKRLRYWKTEHNESTCQDAYAEDNVHGPTRSLFAVADGAGTTLFPAIWAKILAEHFATVPLMSDYPFEVEWWVRLAQQRYTKAVPDQQSLRDWNVQRKAQNQASEATL